MLGHHHPPLTNRRPPLNQPSTASIDHRNDQGALDADAEAATRLIAEHRRKQNSIAVGGFLFLRFLVPAITGTFPHTVDASGCRRVPWLLCV